MSNGKTLPDVPQSWTESLKMLLQILVLVASIVTTIMSTWNNRKIETVRDKQTENTMVIQETKNEVGEAKVAASQAKDIAATHSKKVEVKLNDIDRKTTTIQAKAETVEKKVDAIPKR